MAVLHIRAVPNARKSCLLEWADGRQGRRVLRIRLAAPPVDGKANKELVSFLAGQLGVSKSKILIRKGEKGREKTLEIEGLDDWVLMEKIDTLLAEG